MPKYVKRTSGAALLLVAVLASWGGAQEASEGRMALEQASSLMQQGRAEEAVAVLESMIADERRMPSPRSFQLGQALKGAGYGCAQLGQYEKAVKYLEESLAINRRLHEEIETAQCLLELGALHLRDDNNASVRYSREAAGIFRKYDQQDWTANALKNIGDAYLAEGRCREALANYGEASKLYTALNKRFEYARCLWGMGQAYRGSGQYDKALEILEQALSIDRGLGSRDAIASDLGLIGSIYSAWNQEKETVRHYEEALAIYRELKNERMAATMLSGLGQSFQAMGQDEKARAYFRESLAISRDLNIQDNAGVNLAGLARIYASRGQYGEAIKLYEEALSSSRQRNERSSVTGTLILLAQVYGRQKNYARAKQYLEEALAIARDLGPVPNAAVCMSDLGLAHYNLGEYDKAVQVLRESIAIYEKIRKTAKGEVRRDYLSKQVFTYQLLASVYMRTHDFVNAYTVIETSHARELAEQMVHSTSSVAVPSVRSIQQRLSDKSAVILYSNANWANVIILVITRDGIHGVEAQTNARLRRVFLPQERSDEQSAAARRPDRGVTIVGRDGEKAGTGDKTQAEEGIYLDQLVEWHRTWLISSGDRNGFSKIKFNPDTSEKDRYAGRYGDLLYEMLIEPVAGQLNGKKELIIVPDGVLGFLPFETLYAKKRFLIEQYDIRYEQSMTVFDLVNRRKYRDDRKPMLAFGGAVYDQNVYRRDMVLGGNLKTMLKEKIYASLSRGGPQGEVYAELGLGQWPNLPGAMKEAVAAADEVKGGVAITGEKVTEEYIKRLSREKELARYKVLHFATHAIVVPEVPELSAIVLSKPKGGSAEDGYLRTDEVARLKLNADFVNLSACETGLGKLYNGEGVVGLARSFFIAGTNGLSVSLWQVTDKSTAKFMEDMYELARKKHLSYAAAISEMKRRFINGTFNKNYRSPYYWAPFVYYGL